MYLPAPLIAALAIRQTTPATTTTASQSLNWKLRHVVRGTNLIISSDGHCGGNTTCLGSTFGDSCSQYNWCGSNSSYSGAGCQSDFGKCDDSPSSTNDPSSAPQNGLATLVVTATITITPSPSATASPPDPLPSTATGSTPDTITSAPSSPAPANPSSPAPADPSSPPSSGSPNGTYIKVFLGNGSPSSGWPSLTQWLDFESLWTLNQPIITHSCAQFSVPLNSPAEISTLKSSILSLSKSAALDPRFVLAIALQESNGCVRAPTTAGYVANPGIFQSFDGKGSCNGGAGKVQTPCPDEEIEQMVEDGVEGKEMSLTIAYGQGKGDGAQKYYQAARVYNSGSVAADGNLEEGVATHCYATDVANRLLGWMEGPTGCTLN